MSDLSDRLIMNGAKAMVMLGQRRRLEGLSLPSRLDEARECLKAATEGLVVIRADVLREAVDSWAALIPYKSEYLVEKHGDLEEIAEFRAKYLPEVGR